MSVEIFGRGGKTNAIFSRDVWPCSSSKHNRFEVSKFLCPERIRENKNIVLHGNERRSKLFGINTGVNKPRVDLFEDERGHTLRLERYPKLIPENKATRNM